MAIYGQSWRQPFGAQFSGNMSFRNPMAKAAMNNNPMGNQQTLKPMGNQSSLTPMNYSRDGVSPPKTFSDAYPDRRNNISNINDINTLPSDYHLGSSDLGFLKNGIRPTVFPFPQLANNPGGHPATIASPDQLLENYREQRGGAGPDMAQVLPKNNPAAPVPQGLRQPAPTPAPVGMSMPNGLDAFQPTPAPSLQQRRQQWQQIAAGTPQYINPEFRAGQANMQRLNQSMAQTLNRPLQRRADAIAGVQPGPMINPNAARNVLMGQSPDADLSMRPMTIPGMKFDPQQNAMVRSSPYEARGIQPGSLRQDPVMAFEKFDNPDDFRVATGGMAMIPPPAARSVKPEYVQNSLDNARIARAARMRGVTASGIDQWRSQSPIAKGILQQSPARLAALRERMQPAAATAVAPEIQPPALQTPAIAPPPVQNTGMNNLVPETPQVQPVAPQVQAGVPQVQPDAQIPVDPKRLKAPNPYSSRIYPGMPRGEIRFNQTPNAFSSALRAFNGYQGN